MRRICVARTTLSQDVCLSVTRGILSTPLNISSKFFYHQVDPPFYFFSLLNGMAIEILPPLGGPGRNIAITFGAEKVKGCGYSFSVLTQWCGKQMVNKFDDKFDDNVYSFRYNTQT